MFFSKIEHPSYSNATGNYDFALLKLEIGFNLPMIPFVSPACLPSADSPENVDVSVKQGDQSGQ